MFFGVETTVGKLAFGLHLGFARSFGMRLASGERREWIKPIMFSGGLGSIEDAHVKKEQAEKGEIFG